MLDLIQEIRNCIASNNLRCALGMALTLPDMCSLVEFPELKNETGKRYTLWCEKYLFNQGYLPSLVVDHSKPCEEWEKIRIIEPDMCYKLRCAFLHSGNLELNQRNGDDFPVFQLHISSQEENGVYTDRRQKDEDLCLDQVSLDVRRLTRVLCNAAKEYYDKHDAKEEFNNHHVRVIDVEKEASDFVKAKSKYAKLQESKRNIKSFEELSDRAKETYRRYQNGEGKAICNELETDKELLFAIEELIEADLLTIPSNKKMFRQKSECRNHKNKKVRYPRNKNKRG